MQQFRKIEDGFYIGPQPAREDLEEARRQGVRTVIDFRLPTETVTSNEDLARSCGLDYVNIPVDKARLSSEQIGRLDQALEQKQGPFLIHCASGARAAMLLALSKARRHQWSAERTFEEARAMGFDLRASPDFSAFVSATTGK
jgi:uncharacterized protein (TIGR01244 family)